MSEYKVMLDITLLETLYVEAENKEEAIEQAKRESNFVAEGGDAQVFEVTKL